MWHNGLFYKIKCKLAVHCYLFIKSYVIKKYFPVSFNDANSKIYPIRYGVPRGNVLKPVLHQIYTSDYPLNSSTSTATFAHNTAILSAHYNIITSVSKRLQDYLNKLKELYKHWKIKINRTKRSHIVFKLRKSNINYTKIMHNRVAIPTAGGVKYLKLHLD